MTNNSRATKSICPVCRTVYGPGSGDFCRSDGALLESYLDPGESTFLGKYRLIEEIGRGGWGTVYAAEHTSLGKRFAIKVLSSRNIDRAQKERFEREAKVLSMLNHPGAVSVVDYGIEPAPYIVMEYVQGETLHEMLEKGRMTRDQAADFFLQLAEVLEACHEKGLVHRDIKPANIMLVQLADRSVLKLLDFGLATADVTTTLTEEGRTLGTPSYMSPEQCVFGGVAQPPSDIYSAGCVLYECFTGKKAVDGADPQVCFYQHVNVYPPRFATSRSDRTELALDDLVFQCLLKEPKDRPTAAMLRQKLRALLYGKQKQPPFVLIGSVVALLVIVGLAVFAVQKWAPPPVKTATQNATSLYPVKENDLKLGNELGMPPVLTFVPNKTDASPLIICTATPELARQTTSLCRRWAAQGLAVAMLQPSEDKSKDSIDALLGSVKDAGNPLGEAVDTSKIALASVGMPPSAVVDLLKGGRISAALILDPESGAGDKNAAKEFKNISLPIFFLVDATMKKKEKRMAAAQFCEKAFLLSKGNQIFLNSAHAPMLDNQESGAGLPIVVLMDRFWSATIFNSIYDKSFLLSSRALDSLNGSSSYKWRVSNED